MIVLRIFALVFLYAFAVDGVLARLGVGMGWWVLPLLVGMFPAVVWLGDLGDHREEDADAVL